MRGRHIHQAYSRLIAVAASHRACRPIGPSADFAIDGTLWRRARHRLIGRRRAARHAVARRRHQRASARLCATTTGHGAGPLGPRPNLTRNRAARHGARLSLHRSIVRHRALAATSGWRNVSGAGPRRGSAGGAAGAPRAPRLRSAMHRTARMHRARTSAQLTLFKCVGFNRRHVGQCANSLHWLRLPIASGSFSAGTTSFGLTFRRRRSAALGLDNGDDSTEEQNEKIHFFW